jgi:hypothetical protein
VYEPRATTLKKGPPTHCHQGIHCFWIILGFIDCSALVASFFFYSMACRYSSLIPFVVFYMLYNITHMVVTFMVPCFKGRISLTILRSLFIICPILQGVYGVVIVSVAFKIGDVIAPLFLIAGGISLGLVLVELGQFALLLKWAKYEDFGTVGCCNAAHRSSISDKTIPYM